MASLSEFNKRIRVRTTRIVANTDRLVRRAATAIDQALVSSTPVDTGRARSNWIASINAPASSVIEAYVPGVEGVTGAQNAQAALTQAAGVISGYKTGQEIHLTNNLPYIGRLNDGFSRQAPANFVEEAILIGSRVVQSSNIVGD